MARVGAGRSAKRIGGGAKLWRISLVDPANFVNSHIMYLAVNGVGEQGPAP